MDESEPLFKNRTVECVCYLGHPIHIVVAKLNMLINIKAAAMLNVVNLVGNIWCGTSLHIVYIVYEQLYF